MLVFPLKEETCDLSQYCRMEPFGEAFVLRFYRNGNPLPEPVVASCPEGEQYALLDSMISGGTYKEFLSDALERFNGRICLYLRPQALRFPLPCADGRGEPLTRSVDPTTFRYSESLCAFWRMDVSHEPCMILADGDRSIRDKYRAAMDLGVPYLIATPEALDTAKAP